MAKAIDWETDYDVALKKAKQENKIVMAFVYTDWCPYCRKMQKETFMDADVEKKATASFIAVKINPDKSTSRKRLAESWGVKGYPNIIFFDAGGTKIDHIKGAMDAKGFLSRMERAATPKTKPAPNQKTK
jgi:thiol:disulfide interchange protein